MPKQLSFFETPQPNVPKLSPVLAAFPDPDVAQEISYFGRTFREKHEFTGPLRPAKHLHVSLPFPEMDRHAPQSMLEIVADACTSVAEFAKQFEMRFHWVTRFRGSGAIVLWNDNRDGNEGILNLGRLLCAEYARRGLRPPPASKFSPHLTLLYDEREFHTTPIAPISFMVNEIALVLSEVGATKYHPYGRWQLGNGDSKLITTQP